MTTRTLLRTIALAALAATLNVTRAEEPDKPAKPHGGKGEVKPNKVDITIPDGIDPKIMIKPVEPATRPAAGAIRPHVAADVQKLIDEMVEAYGKLQSLELAGDFTGDIEAAGQHTGGHIAFTASFKAPNQFRHDGKDDVLIGSTGEKAYAFASHDHVYLQADAPKEKVASHDLPKGFHDVLADQDPSLRFALAKDPATELFDNVTEIVKAEDSKIAGVNCPTLKLTLKDKTTAVLAIDPATHLLRRLSLDVRAQLESRQIPDIKRATYTVDYTTITPDAKVKADQFVWAPPAGAKDIKDVKEPSAGGGADEEPAMALVGKEVPDFTLPGLDGKNVSRADLKGTVYILDIWATWCGPCRQSLPHLDELYQAKKAAGLKVFAINLQEDKAKVEEFVKTTKLRVPVLLDQEGKTPEPFKANGIPETIVVGKDGKVVRVFVGFDPDSTPEQLMKVVDDAMKE